MKLEIKDLHVETDGKEIVKGISLTLETNKVHVLMGPNGCGKTTLSYALMGHPKTTITKGQILLDGEDITSIPPNEKAKKGLFLSFQHPSEISGITVSNFLRAAKQAITGENISVIDFHKLLKEKMSKLKMDSSFSRRYLNEKFSGGEKKRTEMLQMSVLEPKFAILDETDSGLDRDALQIVAEGINESKNNMGILLITHYNRFLELITPDQVSIMKDGKIIKSGSKELAEQIEAEGFANV